MDDCLISECTDYLLNRSGIEYMKNRISFLEHQGHHSDNGNLNLASDPNPTFRDEAQSQEQPSTTNHEDGLHGRPMHDASNEVEYLSLTAMSGGNQHNRGLYQGSTFSKVMESLVSFRGDTSAPMSVDDKPSEQLETTLQEVIDKAEKLTGKGEEYFIETFCKVTSWSLAFASNKTCLDAVQAVRHMGDDAAQNRGSQTVATNAVLACVSLGVGILMSPFHATLRYQLSKLITISQRMLPNASTQESDVTAIQCLIAETMLSLYDPAAGSAWHLLGLALTKAISAGLHRVSQSGTSEGSTGNTIPLFWTLYVLDRAMAVTMSRPFGLEDEDLPLNIPDIPAQHPTDDNTAASEALFLWRVQHARLLSDLRRKSNLDLDTSFASYQYWRDTYRELFARLKRARLNDASDGGRHRTIDALIEKDELQLSCRTVILLIDLCIRHEDTNQESFQKLQQHAISEIPCLLKAIQICIDSHDIAISFLDGYDALASAIVYAFCLYKPHGSRTFHLNMTQMRTITASIDILQRVSQQFKAMRGLKDIIWSFLAALEAKGDQSSLQNLESEYARCEIPVPSHVKRITKYCL